MLAILAAAVLASCSEKPARPAPEGEQAYSDDSQLRERTLKQGESGRMSY